MVRERPRHRARAPARRLPLAPASCPRRVSRAAPGRRLRTSRRRGELHTGTPGLAEPDRDRLLRRAGAMLALADVVNLFAHELARLRRGGLPAALVLAGALQRLLLRHDALL